MCQTGLQRCQAALRGEPVDRPPFLPAVYEHKAWFLGRTPSEVARDPELLFRAVLAEYERLQPDALTVGIDVYNIEAEAVGCKVTFYEPGDPSVPGIGPNDHVIRPGEKLTTWPIPDPRTAGRMPMLVETARRVTRELGDDVWVRGALSGPFSLAVSLAGAESVFIATVENHEFVTAVLDYAGRVIQAFGRAYIEAGVDVVIFDSQASPDLLPPDMYERLVLPVTRDVIASLQAAGACDVPLIIGGNTTPIAEACIATGANNLLCDFTADWPTWLARCRAAGRAVRRNLDPKLVQTGPPETVYAATRQIVQESEGYPGFLLGTAVVPYGTPTENLLAVRQACRDT